MPTNGFSIQPLKVKLLAGEQKATEGRRQFRKAHKMLLWSSLLSDLEKKGFGDGHMEPNKSKWKRTCLVWNPS